MNINPGETVNLDLKLGGTLTNPQLKTDLKGAAGNMADALKRQAMRFAQAKADSAKRVVKDTVAALKGQALDAAKGSWREGWRVVGTRRRGLRLLTWGSRLRRRGKG